jgi:hypothetical protein
MKQLANQQVEKSALKSIIVEFFPDGLCCSIGYN